MNIIWIGGDHPRHLYYANTINKKYPLSAAIIQKRESILLQPPSGVDENDKKNFTRHFENREKSELLYFGNQELPDCKKLYLERKLLNSEQTAEFIKNSKPDLVLLYGCDLIKEPLYSILPRNTINLHGGLSPKYKGTATLFWPFYFMEPNYAGSTFHYIVSEPDAGGIIHQSLPSLERNDGIHDVACKTILSSANDALKLIKIFDDMKTWITYKQRGGRNFLSSDFRPEHLRVIYDLFNDDMVKYYLDGKLKVKSPNIIRQFN